MSELTTAARPYARAVFDTAVKNNAVEHWTQMLALCAQVAEHPLMQTALDNPALNGQQCADLFNQVCAQQLDSKGCNLIRLLAENDRLALLPDIAALYHTYKTRAAGRVDAELVSALEVSEDQKQALAASLSKRLGKQVSLTTRIDGNLIGGAIVRAGDIVIDGSVRGRLNKMCGVLAD